MRSHLVAFALCLAVPAARSMDDDSLRLRKAGGGVELSWTDPTPTVACVLRDATAPPSALLRQVSGLSFIDAPPSASLLFYDVEEPPSGSCGIAPPTCAPVAALTCGATDTRNTGDAGSSSVFSDYANCFASGLTGREMVYAFDATVTDTIEARLFTGGTSLDVLVLQDQGAGCATATCVAMGDVTTSFAATAGQRYYMVVDGVGAPADYTVGISCPSAACRPDQAILCGQAIAHDNAWPVDSDVNDAYPCSSFDYSGPESAFRFTATQSGTATATISNLTAELDVLVTEEIAGCSPATCIAWGDTTTTFPITAGETYDVIIDGRNGEEGFFRLDVGCAVPASDCDPQGTIRCGDVVGNDTAAGRSQVDAYACSGNAETGPEYVYVYAPTQDATVRVVMDVNVEDLDLFVIHDGAAGCSPDDCIAWGDQEVTFDAVAGQVYSIIVDGRGGVSDTFRLWMDCRRAPGACRPTQPITCGQTISGRNDAPGSTQAIDTYDCRAYPETGPEITYAFTATSTGNATATLSNMSADLDVFVLRDDGAGCNQESCIAAGNVSADFPVAAGTTYDVVVEGFVGAVGSFDLTLSCF